MPQSVMVRVTRWIELAHRLLAPALVRVGAMRGVAVEILRDGDLGGEFAPRFGHLDIFLAEHGLAAVVGDFRGAVLPLDFVKRRRSPAWRSWGSKARPVWDGAGVFMRRTGVS